VETVFTQLQSSICKSMTELCTVQEQPQNMWFKSGLVQERQSGVPPCVLALPVFLGCSNILPVANPEVLEGPSSEELLFTCTAKLGLAFQTCSTRLNLTGSQALHSI